MGEPPADLVSQWQENTGTLGNAYLGADQRGKDTCTEGMAPGVTAYG